MALKRPIIAALGTLLVVILALWGMSGQKQALLVQKSRLAVLSADLANLDRILSDEKQYGETIRKVEATLPKEYSDVAATVSLIELTAKSDNLATDFKIDEKPKAEQSSLYSLSMVVKTTGSYTDIAKFTSDLSLLPYHTHVDAITFDGVGGKVNAAITVRLFMGGTP